MRGGWMDRCPWLGWTDGLTPVTSTGVCGGEAQGSRTWSGHAVAGRAPAHGQAEPAAVLTLQHAVRARPAGTHAVPHLRAGLGLHLTWRRDRELGSFLPLPRLLCPPSLPRVTGSWPQDPGAPPHPGHKRPWPPRLPGCSLRHWLLNLNVGAVLPPPSELSAPGDWTRGW